MIANDLTPEIWNSIADQIRRSTATREIYFVTVTKVDKVKLLLWADDFGDLAIPLVAFSNSFVYFDTQPVGNVTSGSPVPVQLVKKEDVTQQNPALQTVIICPDVGDVVVVLDPFGARTQPFCIGIVQSKSGYWEGG